MGGSSIASSSGVGLLLTTLEGITIEYAIRLGFRATSNEAEYEPLIVGLSLAIKVGATRLSAHTDYKLVEGQVTREYEAKEEGMKKYLARVRELMSHFKVVEIKHMLRCQNEHTDQLARLASDDRYVMDNRLPVSRPSQPSMEIQPELYRCVSVPADD